MVASVSDRPAVEHLAHALVARPAQVVDAGVDDEPCRAPGHRVQHAEALGLVAEEAHLVGEVLAVEAPALDVRAADHPRAQAPERRQVRVLHLEGDLEVMSGRALVVGRRGELRERARPEVVGVDVVDAGARAVGARRVVVGERRVRLLELLDGANLERRAREAAEVPRRGRHRPLDVLVRPVHEVLAAVGDIRRVGAEVRPVRDGVVAEALGAGDRSALALDLLELLDADAMQVLGVEIERGPGPDLGPVQLLAIGRRPQPGLLATRGAVLAPEAPRGRPRRPGSRPARRSRRSSSRSDSFATRAVVTIAESAAGIARMRSICAIVRSVAIRGAVRPDSMPSMSSSRFAAMNAGYARIRATNFSNRSGVSARWNWVIDRQGLLRPFELVDDLEPVHSLVVLLHREVAHHADHVERDALLERERVLDRSRSAALRVASMSARVFARPTGPGSGRRSSKRSSP